MLSNRPPANSLLGLFGLAPTPLATVTGSDGIDTRYRFDVYGIYDRPSGVNAVYVFARQSAQAYVPLYIGRAEILSERLTGHERLSEAIMLGASHLLVHIPGPRDRIGFEDAERRLISRFGPPLNVQHNAMRSFLGA